VSEPARVVAVVYVAVLGAVGAVAAITTAAFAGPARDFLDFGFPGVPARLDASAEIFASNLRVMLTAFVGCFVAQWPWLQPGARPSRAWRRVRRLADTAVLVLIVINTMVIGLALGGYGERMLRAMLPHGPVELLAFSGALALYLTARRRRLDRSAVLWLGGGSIFVLALAAALEAFGR
jgi:hypothetical protein